MRGKHMEENYTISDVMRPYHERLHAVIGDGAVAARAMGISHQMVTNMTAEERRVVCEEIPRWYKEVLTKWENQMGEENLHGDKDAVRLALYLGAAYMQEFGDEPLPLESLLG
jgi:hypothetical protein